MLEADRYTILGVVVLITLLQNPYYASNASLLLSYSAYFGVITRAGIAEEYSLKSVTTSLLVTTFAVLFSSPFMSMLEMRTNLLSPLFNLLLSPVTAVVCTFSFLTPLLLNFPVIGGFMGNFIAPINAFLIEFLTSFAYMVQQKFSFGYIGLDSDLARVIIFSAVAGAGIAVLQFKKKRTQIFFILGVSLLAFLCYNQYISQNLTITAFDSGSEASFVINKGNENYLVLSEDIDVKKYLRLLNRFRLEEFDEVLCCPGEGEAFRCVSQFAGNVTEICETGEYPVGPFSLIAFIDPRGRAYNICAGNYVITFSRGEADMSRYYSDFYFFGSDCPTELDTLRCYYFPPVSEECEEFAERAEAERLEGNLVITINLMYGSCRVEEDAYSFGQ